ncbi:hypothetical protein IQ241_00645 [Romeria aff. gracilis LEGE 07310]|uniref:Arabinogalactan-like protein n=1 Tax=Vasconcelosia minhoensis LEGE 07310 TaxID=915328 RepID=A0A8J7A4P8_9CYAN|nr:hypothetical protein [Romeria gracilis]MBE9075820.1 hypothetical protein [Romeria aff. gracilis LEGE 07310]
MANQFVRLVVASGILPFLLMPNGFASEIDAQKTDSPSHALPFTPTVPAVPPPAATVGA